MKIIFATFLSVTSVFLFIDIIWLSQSFSYFYQPNIGDLLREDVILLPAALFYIIYPLGVTILVVLPSLKKGLSKAIFFNGFVLGFVAYGTYNLTNMATLQGWSASVVVVDMIWGGVLTGVSSLLGTYIARRVLKV
ncbi:MAG: DUF2177 family protein, partial [Planktomarina sp.]|jgi:uncharacterized membrane protein|nr:DUF2177 family protein [Planktomarina sp.]|tara:strand:- start:3533 stop:3940 length:408 start_codon:yes stop_codon:yes gene_type:complete